MFDDVKNPGRVAKTWDSFFILMLQNFSANQLEVRGSISMISFRDFWLQSQKLTEHLQVSAETHLTTPSFSGSNFIINYRYVRESKLSWGVFFFW